MFVFLVSFVSNFGQHQGVVWFMARIGTDWNDQIWNPPSCLAHERNQNRVWILGKSRDWVWDGWAIPIPLRMGMGMGVPQTKQLEWESLIPIPIPNHHQPLPKKNAVIVRRKLTRWKKRWAHQEKNQRVLRETTSGMSLHRTNINFMKRFLLMISLFISPIWTKSKS